MLSLRVAERLLLLLHEKNITQELVANGQSKVWKSLWAFTCNESIFIRNDHKWIMNPWHKWHWQNKSRDHAADLGWIHHVSHLENFASTHLCRIFHLLEALVVQGWARTKLLSITLDFAQSKADYNLWKQLSNKSKKLVDMCCGINNSAYYSRTFTY